MLTFTAENHVYRWKGNVVPSVTQILSPLSDFSMVAPATLEYARARGVAVHKCVQLDILDDLDEASVAQELTGYLSAWRAFRKDCSVTAADFGEPEKQMYHDLYGYAGTPDVPIFLDNKWGVLDVKTAEAMGDAWGPQTAAYLDLINDNTPKGQHKIENRYSLRLRDNGTYRLDKFTDRADWQVFLSCLTLHRWKESHGRSA